MSREVARDVLKLVVSQIALKCGFSSIEHSAVETLIDYLEDFLEEISYQAKANSELSGRTESNFYDILISMENLNIKFDEIRYFCQSQANEGFPIDKLNFTTIKPSKFNGKKENQHKVIPKYLPPFPETYSFKKTPIFNERDENPRKIRELKDQQRVQAENALARLHQHAMGDPNIVNYDQVHDPQSKYDKGGLFAKPKDVLEMVEDLMDVDLPLEKILPTPISLDHAKIKRLTES